MDLDLRGGWRTPLDKAITVLAFTPFTKCMQCGKPGKGVFGVFMLCTNKVVGWRYYCSMHAPRMTFWGFVDYQ